MEHEYQVHEVLIIAFAFMGVGLICGVGIMGGYTQPQHEVGNDLVYLISSKWDDCYLAVDLNNTVGWKCPGFFAPESFHGFRIIVDGNWQSIV